MKLSTFSCICFLATIGTVNAQGTFQNLDFESSVIVPIQGNPSDRVQFAPAFPGWVGYLGTDQQTEALHNNYNLGTSVIGVLGPGWTSSPTILGGSYSATLQAGVHFTFDNIVQATITQTGLVPAISKSIELRMLPFLNVNLALFEVSLGGQNIPLVPLSATESYTIYGGDISSFANQIVELRISAVPTPAYHFSSIVVDDIVFSSQPIPEPSAFGLFGLGALLLGWRLRWRRKL